MHQFAEIRNNSLGARRLQVGARRIAPSDAAHDMAMARAAGVRPSGVGLSVLLIARRASKLTADIALSDCGAWPPHFGAAELFSRFALQIMSLGKQATPGVEQAGSAFSRLRQIVQESVHSRQSASRSP